MIFYKTVYLIIVKNDLIIIIFKITPYSVSEQIGHLDWFRVLNIWEKLSHSMRKVGDMVGIEEGFIVKAMTGTSFSTASDVSL